MSADSPRRSCGIASRGVTAIPAVVPPQVVSDRSILDSAIGFINEVTLAHQPPLDPKDTITWARFETSADISDLSFGEDWELEGNVAPPLLLTLGYGLGVQVWAIPANGEAVEVLSWRHGIVTALRVLPTPLSTGADEENGRADEPVDVFGEKRPLIALVDGSSSSGTQPQFCAVNFVSLKTGAQVKTIKFKNPVLDILANRSSVVITLHERIAVFDARTLEDRLTITTCFPSPGINPNPATLGPRWLAYAENKLLHTKRSGGGCDGDGVASYTATVLNASKSLVKGLRELGEQVAAGLTGTSGSTTNLKNVSFDSGSGLDTKQAGVVTIIDIKNTVKDYSPTSGVPSSSFQAAGTDTIIAHFVAHSEALVAMEFDNSGMLLVTADRRGHDFHVFRIQPNPVGSSLAAVHHLYILHRGDTSAKVQNITLTLDSRWVAVSTLRGTTHVFPITPYGGSMGVRTHSSLHVVNKLSRFHRSAGLSGECRSNSPISHSESTTFSQSLQPYNNSTLPPFPRPTVVMPLAQLRQPFALGSPPGSASLAGVKSVTGVTGSGSQRQRLSSLSDDCGKPLSVCAIFAKSRSWLLDPPNVSREAPHRLQRKAVDSLFIMAGHGALIQYDLDTKLASNIVKEKICDDTPIELEVEAKAQWNLGRRKEGSKEITPPLLSDNWLIKNRNSCMLSDSSRQYDDVDDRTESWLSQVEIITHAGPHRRLWMGPQFVFKTYNTPSGSNLNHVDTEAVEIGTIKSSSVSNPEKFDHSSPLNMPLAAAGRSSAVPVLIESGSYSSIEQSPKLMDRFRHDHLDSDYSVAHGDSRLKEDLADAMRESPSAAVSLKECGRVFESAISSDNGAFYNALMAKDEQVYGTAHLASAAALASVLPNIHSYDNSSSYETLDSIKTTKNSIEKIVNPLGTVTTITSCLTDVKTDILDEVVSQLTKEDTIIHENCDESLFRPVVAIFCDEKTLLQNEEEARKHSEQYQPPEVISSKLVVPVIAKEVNDELRKREREKTCASNPKTTPSKYKVKEVKKIEELPFLNKKPKEGKKPKTIEEKFCAYDQEVDKNFEKLKTSEVLSDISTKQNKKTFCDKKETVLKETSAEMQVIQKINLKKGIQIHGKRSKELQEQKEDLQSNLSVSQKKQQEIKKISNKAGEESSVNVQDTWQNVEIVEANIESDLSVRNEQVEKEKINHTTKIVNSNESQEHVNETSGELSSNISPICEVDQKELQKTKSETHVISTSYVSNKKEKLKKNKDSTKNNKIASDQDLNDLKKTEKKNEPKETVKSKINNKSGNENVLTTNTNTFVYEPKDNLKSKTVSEQVIDKMTLSKQNNKIENLESSKNLNEKDQERYSFKERSTEEWSEISNAQNFNECIEENLNEEQHNSESFIKKIENNDKSHKTTTDQKEVKKTSNTELQYSDFFKSTDKCGKKNMRVNYSECVKLAKESMKADEKVNVLESLSKSVKPPCENDSGQDEKHKFVKEIVAGKNVKTTKIMNSYSDNLSENDIDLCKIKQDDVKNTNCLLTQETSATSKQLKKDKLSDIKTGTKSLENDNKDRTPSHNTTSPKKKVKEFSKLEISKRKTSNLTTSCKDIEENKEFQMKKEHIQEDKTILKCDDIKNELKEFQRMPSPILPPVSVWKTLSGADMINKNLNKPDCESNKSSLLGTESKIKISDKLLPEIPTPAELDKQKNSSGFLIVKSLDQLPPLPDLEPLKLMTENKSTLSRDASLITFESPLTENSALQRKITPAPRGFTEQNLILALCGSLHFENEQIEKTEVSPTFSSNQSSLAFEETSLAEYKSLTENDELYISLDQSSQDTNTNTTNTNNEKFFSSTNSSGSEEIVKTDEKKIAKKQKRKKQQQQLKDVQKGKNHQEEIDDEELRPLIAMTESQVYQTVNNSNEALPSSSASFIKNQSPTTQPLLYSTTTDSEGPLPATTSDDNVFSIPVPGVYNTHKIKTKKLEHKINLIAAIEAATSSSTSSAEESGIELGGRTPNDNDESLISEANSISTSTIPLPIVATSQTAVGGLKKKTKRRKR